jgi:hypothetical protein
MPWLTDLFCGHMLLDARKVLRVQYKVDLHGDLSCKGGAVAPGGFKFP